MLFLKPVDLNVPIEVTDMCNLRCKYCYVSAGISGTGIMNYTIYTKVINNINTVKDAMPKVGITFTGGEPLLHSDVVEMIKYAKERDIDRVSIVTNATLLTERLSEKLINAGIDWIAISLDSYRKEVNDALRGEGTYDKVINALKILSQYSIYKSLAVTPTAINITKENVVNIIELARKFGVNSIVFNMIMPSGYMKKHSNLMPEYQEYVKFVELIESEIVTKYYGDIEIFGGEPWSGLFDPIMKFGRIILVSKFDPNTRACSAGISTIGVFSDGRATPCLMLRSEKYIIGDLTKDRLIDIWNHQLLLRMRNEPKRMCASCSYVRYCGGCFARSEQVFGDCFYADPLCPLNAKYVPQDVRIELGMK
jgi:radical SAM protein with 4Fe4S-binding SPASM domain